MGMNIKDPQVHAMAKQLAARRGTSVTDAVRQALQAERARADHSTLIQINGESYRRKRARRPGRPGANR